MAMSGIEVDPDVALLYNDMKLRKTHKWATFKIQDSKKVVIDEKGDPVETTTREEDKSCFDELMKKLVDKQPCYVLYDFGFDMKKEGRVIKKLAFIFCCFDETVIKQKMLYASTKDTVKKSFTGLGIEFQVKDKGDMDYSSMADEIEKKS